MAGRVKKNDATVNDDIAVKESVSAVNTKKAAEAKLNDSDEIEVVSLIPNVSYEDKKNRRYVHLGIRWTYRVYGI